MKKNSLRDYTEQQLISLLHSTGEYEEHVDFEEAHIYRRGHAINYVVAGSGEETAFETQYRIGLKDLVLRRYQERFEAEEMLKDLREKIASYGYEERIKILEAQHKYSEWGGEWFIPVLEKELERVIKLVLRRYQAWGKVEEQEERRMSGVK